MTQTKFILLWNHFLCLQNKLKNKQTKPLVIPPLVTPPHRSLTPCSSIWALMNFDLGSSTGTFPSRLISSGWGPSRSLGAVRDGIVDSHFTARPGWAVWLRPGVCWSWWRRKGRRGRCWSTCSRSRLLARRTAWRDRPASGRCRDHKPPPRRKKNSLIYRIYQLYCVKINLCVVCQKWWRGRSYEWMNEWQAWKLSLHSAWYTCQYCDSPGRSTPVQRGQCRFLALLLRSDCSWWTTRYGSVVLVRTVSGSLHWGRCAQVRRRDGKTTQHQS